MSEGINLLGPRVIGNDAYEKQRKTQAVTTAQHALGPRVTGGDSSGDDTSDADVKAGTSYPAGETVDVARLSVEELETVLKTNPTFFDRLYLVELRRAEGPRKAALRVFSQRERAQAARPWVLAEIGDLLGDESMSSHSIEAEMDAKREAWEAAQDAETEISSTAPDLSEKKMIAVPVHGADSVSAAKSSSVSARAKQANDEAARAKDKCSPAPKRGRKTAKSK